MSASEQIFRRWTIWTASPAESWLAFSPRKLREHGVETTDPENHEDYAYALYCNVEEEPFWILVGAVEDGERVWLLFARPNAGPLARLWRKPDASKQQTLSTTLHRILQADGRFTSVRWYTAEDWNNDPDTKWSPSP